ncbi:MAG: ferrous iron transport protein A [Anaerolineales bacterium]|nr:ferrous iron transport protein A [Anaerolineales bacterium]MCX7609119.1 ferrous iron transport protein A [Anaerolineales bacterium]MDW8227094.1 FeoA family protein [Anaerolineales bacterium]
MIASTRLVVPLSEVPPGERAWVHSFHAGRVIENRLASLGFTPGVAVEIVQNYGRGPLIVTVRGTRVALGRGEAAKILVERSEQDDDQIS